MPTVAASRSGTLPKTKPFSVDEKIYSWKKFRWKNIILARIQSCWRQICVQPICSRRIFRSSFRHMPSRDCTPRLGGAPWLCIVREGVASVATRALRLIARKKLASATNIRTAHSAITRALQNFRDLIWTTAIFVDMFFFMLFFSNRFRFSTDCQTLRLAVN